MTAKQEAHIAGIVADFQERAYTKYKAGALEHGGTLYNFTSKNLVLEMMAEAIDLYVYAYTLLETLDRREG
jgi:hypothetical protein